LRRPTAIAILLLAAILVAGGDTLIRVDLHKTLSGQRAIFFLLAACVLFAYGWTVNAPPWDFGQLLGIYVVFFFIVAQLISWLVFKQIPSLTVAVGGVLICAGGVVISLGKV
jgi:hypothetical protein